MGREYNEVIEILKYIPKEDFLKIPNNMIEMLKRNAEPNYKFNYNPALTLDEQNVSKKAKFIIAILFKKYWATEKQREKIFMVERQYLNQLEEQKKEQYSTENLFKNRKNS